MKERSCFRLGSRISCLPWEPPCILLLEIAERLLYVVLNCSLGIAVLPGMRLAFQALTECLRRVARRHSCNLGTAPDSKPLEQLPALDLISSRPSLPY